MSELTRTNISYTYSRYSTYSQCRKVEHRAPKNYSTRGLLAIAVTAAFDGDHPTIICDSGSKKLHSRSEKNEQVYVAHQRRQNFS